MARVVVRWIDADGELQTCGLDDIERSRGFACWVDVAEPDEETLMALASPFGLHPLAVEDALHRQSRPKLDLYPEGPFFVWLTPHLEETGVLRLDEADFFMYSGVLVTLHGNTSEAFDEVASEAGDLLRNGVDWVLHALLDRLVDSMLPIADAVGDRLEDVEDRMLAEPTKNDLEELYMLRRQLLALHRVVAPERDMIRTLSREREYVSEEVFRYFDDVVDHLMHAEESLETYREIGSAVMDIYLSAQSNRLNEIMKVLTVVTVVLGALTAISGIYGMNLLGGMWPPPDAKWSFGVVMGAMLFTAFVMSLYFRRKKWW